MIISTLMAWAGARFSGLWTKLILVGGVILAILAAVFQLMAIGRRQERAARDAARLEAIKARKDVDRETDALAPADIDHRLAQWMRDGPPSR